MTVTVKKNKEARASTSRQLTFNNQLSKQEFHGAHLIVNPQKMHG